MDSERLLRLAGKAAEIWRKEPSCVAVRVPDWLEDDLLPDDPVSMVGGVVECVVFGIRDTVWAESGVYCTLYYDEKPLMNLWRLHSTYGRLAPEIRLEEIETLWWLLYWVN